MSTEKTVKLPPVAADGTYTDGVVVVRPTETSKEMFEVTVNGEYLMNPDNPLRQNFSSAEGAMTAGKEAEKKGMPTEKKADVK